VSSTTTAGTVPASQARQRARGGGVWRAAATRFRSDRVGMVSLAIVVAFLALVVAAAAGWIAADWQVERAVADAPPTFLGPRAATPSRSVVAEPSGPPLDISAVDPLAPRYAEWQAAAQKYRTAEAPKAQTLPFGADRIGRDVLAKAIKGAQVSIFVGVTAALLATLIGTALGALGGFLGGKVGDLLEWLYNVFTAIPGILLIFAFAAVFGRGIGSVVLILGLAGWTGIYRLVRAEFIKHAVRDYVRSAEAIGAGPVSYLGLGVGIDQVSWGTMLAEAQGELILGHWWQLAAATLFMAVFVTAFSLMTDALRDALDPKLRGLE